MPLPTLAIPGFDGLSHTVYTAASGRQAAADSSAVALSNEDLAAINAIATALASALPLPTGAASATNQSTLNTNIGAQADTSATTDTGTFSLIALFKRALGYLSTLATAATDVTTQSPVKVLTYTANSKYKALPASSSAVVIGATGATGDYLSHVLIIPATTSPGAVSITDGSGSAITIFTGGASSVTNLVPFVVPVGAVSTSGAWKATTGTNVSIIGFGSLT